MADSPGPGHRTGAAGGPSEFGSLDGAGRLARAVFADAPRRCVLAAGLLLVSAGTETFGIALLIPFLHLAGLGSDSPGPSPIREGIEAGAGALGATLSLPVLLGAFVVLAAVRAGVAWQRQVQLAAMRLGFVDRLRERLYTATAHAGWPVLIRQRQSDLVHALTHDVTRAGQGAVHIMQISVNATFALAQGALAVFISPPVAFGVLLVGGVMLAASRPLVRRSRALGQRLTTGGRAAHAAMTGFLGGLKQAKSDDTQTRHVEDFTDALGEMRRHQLAFTGANAAAQAVFNVGAAAALSLLVWLVVRHAGLSAPEMLVMALIAARVLPGLLRLQQEAQQLAHALPACAHTIRMEQLLRDAAEPPAAPGTAPMLLQRRLVVDAVSFSYHDPPTGPAALTHVDLVIPAHRLVAVTGPSGAGKSTLADLLLGLLEPAAGEISIDGVPLIGAARRRWRRSVAYAPQDPYLFHETIRTNLLRARPGATDADLWRALRLAAAAEFVAALPDGLETVTGDRGARLSGGERQRVVLARALLREPALLLLDEATSQLDAAAERQVLATLRSLRERTTVVAVTHRPAVMEAADHVVLLEAGRVAAAGTWPELAPRLGGADRQPNGDRYRRSPAEPALRPADH